MVVSAQKINLAVSGNPTMNPPLTELQGRTKQTEGGGRGVLCPHISKTVTLEQSASTRTQLEPGHSLGQRLLDLQVGLLRPDPRHMRAADTVRIVHHRPDRPRLGVDFKVILTSPVYFV